MRFLLHFRTTYYKGGDPADTYKSELEGLQGAELEAALAAKAAKQERYLARQQPAPYRAKIVSIVTCSEKNKTALEYVKKVYDYIRNGTDNDPRIEFQTLCFTEKDKPVREQNMKSKLLLVCGTVPLY